MNNKQKWTKQELLAAELELMANEANQAPLSDQQMTAFLEGQLPPAERDQAMEQILNSPISLSILKTSLTLPDLPEKESIRGRVLPFRKWLPQLTVIAAVLLMALGLFFFPPTDQPINQGTITLTAELRYLLINHESPQFQDRDSLQLWAKNLKAAGFNIQELKKVELDQEYLSTKGPIAPLEEVVFHFQDGVLYISIRQKEEK